MSSWTEIFSPVQQANPHMAPRVEQEKAGNAIIDAFSTGVDLVLEAPTGTGKSLAVLVPMIDAVTKNSKPGKKKRGIVSTETTALQNQYVDKDLPFLQSVYKNFSFRVLKGRNNYLCHNSADLNSRGNMEVANLAKRLHRETGRLGDGERRDVERVLGYDLEDNIWAMIAGSSKGCGENKCTSEECYSARARALALQADIVVVNHALLRVDADSRKADDPLAENFLGPVDYLAVDEAHTLEKVLIDGWAEHVTEWELNDKIGSIATGVEISGAVNTNHVIGYQVQQAIEDFHDFLKCVTRFYGYLHEDQEWRNVMDALCLRYMSRGAKPAALSAMREHEEEGPKRLDNVITTMEAAKKYLKESLLKARDADLQGTRKISKGMNAAQFILETARIIRASMDTKDGIVNDYGVATVVTVSGIERRNGERSVRISTTPLDASVRASDIWRGRACVLLSATLRDLTDGSFRYLVASLGVGEHTELVTASPFNYQTSELVYITPALSEVVDIKGAKYSFDELSNLIDAANGRTLALYTARSELDDGAERMVKRFAAGEFPHKILVQDKSANKSKLVSEFTSDTHSVLFGTKSMFTGIDAPGETCSMVAICKYPLPQYNVICKAQIKYWASRGFPDWYERESLTVFNQARGRGIRKETDRVVIAILDQRVANPNERVCQTAMQGVRGFGSPVTRSIEDVKKFLS